MSMKDLVVRNQRWPSLSLHKEMDRLINGFFEDFGPSEMRMGHGRFSSFAPKMNVSEDETAIEISVELPGMNEKDIEVSLDKNVLTVKGEKKEEIENKDTSYHHLERSYGTFQRSVRISEEVDSNDIKASFKDGLLLISLPKVEKEPARVIEVNPV